MLADEIESELARWGPFFGLHRAAPGDRPTVPWRPVATLTDDPQVLGERVTQVRSGLAERSGRPPADVPVRIAASVTHLGLVARLLSPLLGLALLTDRSGDRPGPAGMGAGMGQLWWKGPPAGAFPLLLAGARPETGYAAASLVYDLTVLTDSVARRWRVSTKVLWGNVASAANGIATQATMARPDLAGPIRTLTGGLADALPRPGLFEGAPGAAFRRRTCCLLVHAWPTGDAPAVRCGDCVLNPSEGSVPGRHSYHGREGREV